jgi:hypothetical protein
VQQCGKNLASATGICYKKLNFKQQEFIEELKDLEGLIYAHTKNL